MYPFLENSTTEITLKIEGEPRFVNLIEENRNIYKCVICSAIFEKEEKVQDHITSVHEVPEEKIRHIEIVSDEGIKSYKCLICSVDFPEEKIVKKHISDEHGPALFKCDFESCEYTNPRIRFERFACFFSCSLKTREKDISFAQLVLLDLYIF